MQIISYLDRNITTSAFKKEASLDMLLKHQNFSRAKVKSLKIGTQVSVSTFVEEVTVCVSALSSFLAKRKIQTLSCAVLLALLIAIPSVINSIPQRLLPASLSSVPSVEMDLLNTAMASFVFKETADAFDNEGNVGTKTTTSAKTIPSAVQYSQYTVKAGDNISTIAKKFGLANISTLIAVNNISNVRLLRAGQKIVIPSLDGMIHTVKKGDSLAFIAQKYGISVESILDVNDLSSSVIQTGDKLFIPGARLNSEELRQALGELFMSPLSVSWRLSSAYGYRNDPFTGVRSFHTGIDMVAPQGTAIKASMAGRVAAAGYTQVYGNYVILSHTNGYQTLYAHLHTISVKAGQSVSQGAKVGLLGNTGYSTGAHLHFSVYKNGSLVNPLTLLK